MTLESSPALQTRALARYIEQCPPSLHPDCPYAEELADGRHCGQECEDDLDQLVAGNCFDIREITASDQGMPDATWMSLSLLRLLVEQATENQLIESNDPFLAPMTAFRRQVAVTSAAAELAGRGLDMDRFVRDGLGPLIVEEVCFAASVGMMDMLTERTEVPANVRNLAARLSAAVRDDLDRTAAPNEIFQQLLLLGPTSDFARSLHGWVRNSTLQAVLLWWLPSEGWDQLPRSPATTDPEMTWFRERMSESYIDQWSTESLHREFQWRSGSGTSLPETMLLERPVGDNALAGEIARRASANSSEVARQELSSHSLVRRGVDLLRDGQYELAAALFEGAASQAQGSQKSTHLRGQAFCLIPVDPSAALRILDQIANQEADKALFHCNVTAAALRLGDSSRAAQACGSAETAAEQESGYVWDVYPSGEIELIEQNAATHSRDIYSRWVPSS